jgi:subtilisin family serine protease
LKRTTALFTAAMLVPATMLGVYTATADAAQTGVASAGPNAVPGQYVVVLDDDVTDVAGTAHRLAQGAKVTRVYRSALKGFTIRTTAKQAKRIAAASTVASVQQDAQVHATADVGAQTTQAVPAPPNSYWGLNRIDQRTVPPNTAGTYNHFFSAPKVTAYVVDTGINYGHSQFGGRASLGVDEVGGVAPPGSDCYGHGTHVAGTIGGATYGVAKSVKLKSVRVLDCSGSGTWSGVIAGLDWITGHAAKPAVMNASLGGGQNIATNIALNNMIESGVTAVVSAGNSNDDACSYSPGSTLSAITVGATGLYENPAVPISDARSSFSNYGSCLDLFAPGSNIKSAWIGSSVATNTISGTSMASPHVAGVAALYLSGAPTANPMQVRNYLTSFATLGVVVGPGPGSPNRMLFAGGVATLTADATPEPVTAGTTVTVKGALKLQGKPLARRAVEVWFDRAGATPPARLGTVLTSSTGVYVRAQKQFRDGSYFAVYRSQPLILGRTSPADYVDCTNC